MAGVEELERHAAAYLARLVHVGRHKQLHQRVDVMFVVQRLEELLAFPAAPFVDVFEVALLQEARVPQHYVAEVRRGLTREHPAPEALPDKLRQVPGMVDVRVRQYHIVYLGSVNRKVAVLLKGLLAMALIETALEEYPLAVRLEKMH